MNTPSQQNIKDLVRNQTNGQGTFYIAEKLHYEGQEIHAYLVIPQSLATKAEEIKSEVFSHLEEEDEEEVSDAPAEPKTDKKVPAKKPAKKTTKKK